MLLNLTLESCPHYMELIFLWSSLMLKFSCAKCLLPFALLLYDWQNNLVVDLRFFWCVFVFRMKLEQRVKRVSSMLITHCYSKTTLVNEEFRRWLL